MIDQALIEAYRKAKANYEEMQRTDHTEYKKICQWLIKNDKEKK